MARRLTPEEKARREKEAKHKRWLKNEHNRIKKKKEEFALNERRQRKNVLYEQNLKEFVDLTLGLDVIHVSKDIVYPFYRFFFPYKMATPKGKLNPIEGFSTEVALRFIDTLIKAGHYYGQNYPGIYDIFCNHRMTGGEFIKAYNRGVNSYKKLFAKAPAELLYRLYNVRVPGSTARGAGEYLLCLKISDVVKGKNGDICTKTGICLEAKAFDGRLDCQIPSDVKAMGDWMLGDGMIEGYKILKSECGWSDRRVIEKIATHKIKTYNDFLTKEQKDLFVRNMTENWDGFFINGEFTEESINRINGCHDAYVYPLLEKFTHLKVDTRQPFSIKYAKDFDVKFSIFNRNEFATPGCILQLVESGYIRFYGFIKNNGRDKAVHVGI